MQLIVGNEMSKSPELGLTLSHLVSKNSEKKQSIPLLLNQTLRQQLELFPYSQPAPHPLDKIERNMSQTTKSNCNLHMIHQKHNESLLGQPRFPCLGFWVRVNAL